MTLVPGSWPRLGRRQIPVPIATDFQYRFPVFSERTNYLQHLRGADVNDAISERGFLRLPERQTVICILDQSGSMSNPAISNINPAPSVVLEAMITTSLIPALTAQGRQGLLVQMPGQPVDFAGESWLHLLGRVGEFEEFNNFIAGDILFLVFSNGAESLPGEPEVYYSIDAINDPYPGPSDLFWEHYSWLAPDFGGGGPFIPYFNAQNYRSLGAIMYNVPYLSATGGPPYEFDTTYNTHLFEAITGTGFHTGFPLNRPDVSELIFFGGEILHTISSATLLATIDNHFASI